MACSWEREGWPKFFSIYNVAITFIYIYLVNEKYYFLYEANHELKLSLVKQKFFA